MSVSLSLTALSALSLALLAGLPLPARADTAIVAGGCFWCVESDFESVPGVISVVSGYTGGTLENPTYKQVGRGDTGHYEAVLIDYDPARVTYPELMRLFLRSIDVTDAGGQFCDRGAPYRTAIFAAGPQQKAEALAAVAGAEAELGQTVVTPVLDAAAFYPAEEYHQDYYKGGSLVLTRAGPKRQVEAYKFYRTSCGRDARVLELWGQASPFAGH